MNTFSSGFHYALILISLFNPRCVLGDDIVFIHTCSTFSHRAAHWPLVESLVAKGHNVTFISPWGPNSIYSNPKVNEIVPQALQDKAREILQSHFDINYRVYGVLPPLWPVVELFCYQVCSAALTSPEVQGWLEKKPKVDLVVADMVPECSYGLSEKFEAKQMMISPIPFFLKYFESWGINPETHSIPDVDATKPLPLSFMGRVTTALIPLWFRAVDAIGHYFYRGLFQRTLGLENIPGVYEIKDKTSLIMTNGDYISEYARSFPPFVVKIEGVHVKKGKQKKPLEKDVENFINSKTSDGKPNDGFVFMSYGTVAKAPNLPLHFREKFFSAIEAFPNIKFIWRWDGEKPEVYPKNLMLVHWVDQQDVLGHPKIRGFLTQAGRPSMQEALFNEVPTLAFPILADQDFNAQRCENLGTCILMDFADLTADKLKQGFHQLLTDKKLKERITQISKLSKDVQNDPVDTALWWTEFVLRHTKEELDLLKPLARKLAWYQKRDLDVWLFILILSIIGSYVWFRVMKKFYQKITSKKDSSINIGSGSSPSPGSSKKSN